MKNSVLVVSVLLMGLSMGCKKIDDSAPMKIALQNEPPLSFDLIDVPDEVTGVGRNPSLSWESAKNPKGSAVTYDLYLDSDVNPATIYESNIGGTSIEIVDRLHLLTDYFWKIVAKDSDGKTSQSPIYKFTTRNLNIPTDAIITEAEFSPRRNHSAVVFNNKLWVIGGRSPGGFSSSKNDVWISTDGISWELATSSAFDYSRFGHSAVVFNDKIWVIAGRYESLDDSYLLDDIWYSNNGTDWQAVYPSFSHRFFHTATVFNNKIWVIGGQGYGGKKNDVWYSIDGFSWLLATEEADFPARSGHTTVVFDNKLWVIGGRDNIGNYRNDIWYSADGFNWTETTSSQTFAPRIFNSATVYSGNIWLIGGWDDAGQMNDIWHSEDGANWDIAGSSHPIFERHGHTADIFKNQIWIIGGENDDGYLNDVWALD